MDAAEQSEQDTIYTLRERYQRSLLAGDGAAAGAVLDEGIGRGIDSRRLCLEILAPAQRRMGELWADGEINIAQEHLATQITLQQLRHLRESLQPRHLLGRRVVVTAVEGESHMIGAAMVALFLRLDGWAVDFLGADVPIDHLIDFVESRAPDVVGLSVSAKDRLETAQDVIAALHRLERPPKVLLGGAALLGAADESGEVGADGLADAASACAVARRLVGLPDPSGSLDQYLADLGARIQQLRKAKCWSQTDLAESTGLTRAYISSLENGKRNLSVGALVKIAHALGETPGYLIA